MRLLIVEPEAEGHHLVLYTRVILKEAIRRGWAVTILTTRTGRRHPAFDTLAADYGDELATIVIPDVSRARSMGSLALLAAQLRLWEALREAARASDNFESFDVIYCINLDYFEKALSLRGSPFGARLFAGMLMNPKFHRAATGLGPPSRGDSLYRLLFKRLLGINSLKKLMVIDAPFQEFCLQQRLPGAEKICLVSDVGELSALKPRHVARDNLGVPQDAFVILVYGSLSRRKGIEPLLRSIRRLDDPRVAALVAGKPDEDSAELLASTWCHALREAGQLVVRAEFHDDESEALVFSAADAVWLGYIGGAYGSSGVLYQAGSAGLPVVSMAEGLVGLAVTTHKLGISLDASDESAVVEAIQLLNVDEVIRRECGENGRRLAESHTGAAFASVICDALAASIAEPRES